MSGSSAVANHPSDAVLLDHVSGSLGFAHRCVVATHLRGCAACRDVVQFWGRVGDRLISAVAPAEPPPDLWDRCLASLSREDAPRRERRTAGSRLEAAREASGLVPPPSLHDVEPGRLRWLAPGLWHKTLWHDEQSALHFIRVRPGVALPGHRHRGLELTCVLSGAYRDGGGRLYTAGDVSEEGDGEDDEVGDLRHGGGDHLVVAEAPRDCVCVMATTGRLIFSGWVPRLLQPIMPF